MTSDIFAGGSLLLGVLIALGAALRWPIWTQYIWAAVAIVWGIFPLVS